MGPARTWHLDNNAVFLWADMLTRIWSPYRTNPSNYNPLERLLERIDFEGLRRDGDAARVFICAATRRVGAALHRTRYGRWSTWLPRGELVWQDSRRRKRTSPSPLAGLGLIEAPSGHR